jgi:uncharacterized protein (TIGR03083 family)
MQPVELLATVPASTAALLASARAAGLDATVPSCEGWRTFDLVAHTAGVYRFVAASLEAGGPVSRKTLPQTPEGEAAFDDLAEAAEAVVSRIRAVGPDGEAWNWSDEPNTGAFWHRRMAHEAAMHAVDAQLANGETPAMDAELAADGIDEMLTVLLSRVASRGGDGWDSIGSLHVHCTDVDGEWLVVSGPDGQHVSREHAKGDAALRGPAFDLLLRLYNRGEGGEVIGDASVLERWRTTVRF